MWYAEVRHGFSPVLTVQAGADAQRDSSWGTLRPYGADLWRLLAVSGGRPVTLAAYEQYAAQTFDEAGIDAAISHAWAGLYEMSPDGNPILVDQHR